ncbi:hypothetical protein GTR02_17740 [Kineococcus sp. R8]|uniref:hypothetical protein n=1 Tax=Kineococcus siccus TaxID=2696567 RepID=UPI001411E337|nr:hypothetical protein [Kineococcus siccus]NAZ83658.1 hypothetical protein [Kineococcus siccus]
MSARTPRTGACTPADARTRLRQARLYLEAAELIQAEDLAEAATVATGNAVLAAIASADAICCFTAGVRSRGQDHRQAIALLQEVTGDTTLARALREVPDLKVQRWALAPAGDYGLSNVTAANCTAALGRARTLVDAAGVRMT